MLNIHIQLFILFLLSGRFSSLLYMICFTLLHSGPCMSFSSFYTHPSHIGEGRAHRAQNQTGTSWRETKRKKTNLKKEKYKKIFIQKNYLAWEYKTDFMKHLWHTVRWKTQYCLYIFNFLFKKLLSNEFLFRLIRKV